LSTGAAETLKIIPEKIHVYTEIDTQYSPWEWQTIGSMFTVQGGRALIRACERAIDKLKENASLALRVDKDMLEYDGEKIYFKHNPEIYVKIPDLVRGYMDKDGVTVGEVVQSTADARLPRYSNPDPETGQGTLGVSYTFGAQGCEIRIDKKTGEIIIDNFASAFDIGRVINPVQLRGQIVGGVMMGIGSTLYEELKFDEEGKLLNPHFSTYRFPTIKEMPKRYEVIFIESPESIGPYGARGIGEHPVLGVAPAILNAIYDAIGVDLFEVPISKEKILEIIKSKQKVGV
jgi:Aerobic-type carbon monoxide dehydrogenase, large subunit CoxL/CutL homologs